MSDDIQADSLNLILWLCNCGLGPELKQQGNQGSAISQCVDDVDALWNMNQ